MRKLLITAILAAAAPAMAANEQLVGRGNEAKIIRKDGSVQHIQTDKLPRPVQGGRPVSLPQPSEDRPKPEETDAAEEVATETIPAEVDQEKTAGPNKPAGKGKPSSTDGQRAKTTPVDEATKVKEETPEQKAAKQQAIDRISSMRRLGGAYFYGADGRPISGAELDNLLASGDIKGIKVVDLHQNEYTPQLQPDPENIDPPVPPATKSKYAR